MMDYLVLECFFKNMHCTAIFQFFIEVSQFSLESVLKSKQILIFAKKHSVMKASTVLAFLAGGATVYLTCTEKGRQILRKGLDFVDEELGQVVSEVSDLVGKSGNPAQKTADTVENQADNANAE